MDQTLQKLDTLMSGLSMLSDLTQNFSTLKPGETVPLTPIEKFPMKDSSKIMMELRNEYVHKYSWAILDQDSINKIAKFIGQMNCLSCFSGNGYLESLINQQLTDKNQIKLTDINILDNRYTSVEQLSSFDAVKKYNYPVLFMSWPPQRSHCEGQPIAGMTLNLFFGTHLIYIGEPIGMSTADDVFFTLIDKYWQLEQKVEIKQWPGIHDSVFLYTRKTVCQVCLKTDQLKRCTRCQIIKYCSKECQLSDWPDHKQICH